MSKKPIFALVDCNNFFVSCERVFAPNLENKPVVVLSSNDGCAISRSNEAKELGIAMGEPFFKFKYLFDNGNLKVLSSNFHLYSNMSWRVMNSLKMLCPMVEVYSIDEAFLDISSLKIENYENYAKDVQKKIKQWTGIPVTVGIAKTKTLAKIANYYAKKHEGILDLYSAQDLDEILSSFPVEEIWGIGRKLALKMKMLGIFTALDLKNADPTKIRKSFTVIQEKIVHELQGISCLEVETIASAKKSIAYTRSFGELITNIKELEQALALYVTKASEKLRKQFSRAQNMCIYIKTNRFGSDEQYSNSISLTLPIASNDTIELIKYAKCALQQIFKLGFKYKKLGVILSDFIPDNVEQFNLFQKNNYEKSDKLMKAMDTINKTIGKDKVFIAAQGTESNWAVKKELISPRYTSVMSEIPVVK